MELYPLKSSLVKPGSSLVLSLQQAFARSKIRPRNRDIVAVASKVVAVSEGRIRPLLNVRPTKQAVRLGREYSLPSEFAQVVVDEADEIHGGVPGALLTLKDGQATANAGVDRKNAPDDSAVLWPLNPRASALRLRSALKKRTGLDLGIVIVDSRVTPMRLGTIGLSLASVGFKSIKDFRGKPDLYGRKARITFQALGDGIAAAAQLLMGEAREAVPFVLVRGAPVEFGEAHGEGDKMRLKDCLYMAQILPHSRRTAARLASGSSRSTSGS